MEKYRILDSIGSQLSILANDIETENRHSRFDINKSCEDYFIPIFNRIFDTDFINLNTIQYNATAIDLISQSKKIIIQVTYDKKIAKVKKCLNSLIERIDFDKNWELYFFILQKKNKKYDQNSINTQINETATEQRKDIGSFIFNAKKNIFDIFDVKNLLDKPSIPINALVGLDDYLMARKSLEKHHYLKHFELKPNKINNWLNQFHNEFIGRENELRQLDQLVKGSNHKIIVINAEPGYGKTRLCLEYFTRNKSNAYIVEPELLRKLESLEVHDFKIDHLFMIDNLDQQEGNFLVRAANVIKKLNKTKLILISRKTFQYRANIQLISRLLLIDIDKPIELTVLKSEETEALFHNFLTNYNYTNLHLPEILTIKSKGIPFLIMLFFQIISAGEDINEILKNNKLLDFVDEYKKEVEIKLSNEHKYDHKTIERILLLIGLLGPINKQELLQIFENVHNQKTDVEEIIEHLILDGGFVYNTSEGITIKPDLYNDAIIIKNAIKIKTIIKTDSIKPYLKNALKNILRISPTEDSKILDGKSFILEVIESLIIKKKIITNKDAFEVISILQMLSNLGCLESSLSKYILDKFLNSLIESNYLNSEDGKYNKKTLIETIQNLFSITALSIYKVNEWEDIYDISLKYVKYLDDDFTIFKKTFNYQKYDFPEYGYSPIEPYQKQKFLLGKIEKLIEKKDLSLFDLKKTLIAIEILLDLSFDGETFYNPYKGTITWQDDCRVPKNKSTTEVRLTTVTYLVKLYWNYRNHELSEKILNQILHVLSFIKIPSERELSKPIYDQNEEVEIVTKFIKQLLVSEASIQEKSAIINRMKLYERNKIKDEFKKLYATLLEGASKINSLKEELYLVSLSHKFEMPEDIQEAILKVIDKYDDSWDQLFIDLIDLSDKLSKIDSGFNSTALAIILDCINLKSPKRSKELYDLIQKEDPTKRILFLELLKVNYQDRKYFYDCINSLLKSKYQNIDDSIAWLLINVRERSFYELEDFEYFESILYNENPYAIRRLSIFIYPYLYVDPTRTLALLKKMIEIGNSDRLSGLEVTNKVSTYLFSNQQINQLFKEELKEFLFNILLPIISTDSHHINRALEFLDNNFGFQTVLDFIEQKFSLLNEEQRLFFDLGDKYENGSKSLSQREDDFLIMLDRFLKADDFNDIKYELILKKFAPGENVNASLTQISSSMIDKLKIWQKKIDIKDIHILINLGEILSIVYSTHDEDFCKYLIDLANIVDSKSSDENSIPLIERIFGRNFIYNTSIMKSRSHGQKAYPIDIQKKEILEKLLNTQEMRANVKAVIAHALENVNQSINETPLEYSLLEQL